MLISIVQSFFSNLEFLYALFLCVHIKGEQLNNLFCEAVGYLEWCGFLVRVLALGFVRLASNHTCFKLHKAEGHLLPNPYFKMVDRQFFSDVPFLIKTVRNVWSNCRIWDIMHI